VGRGRLAVIRQDRRPVLVSAASLVRGWLLGVLLLPGHGMAQPPATVDATADAPSVRAEAGALSGTGVIAVMWRLLHEGRAAEAYQLGQIAVQVDARAAEVRLAMAYAAEAIGSCDLALHHLGRLAGDGLAPRYRQQRDRIRAWCQGPWQRQVTVSLTAGYRSSLVDRARRVSMRLERGSTLHGLCARLRGLCDPEATFRLEDARASGIDLWTQLSLAHLYRDGGHWDFAITPELFLRTPRRKGYGGEGASLRLDAARHLDGGRQLLMLAETGAARFRQGGGAPAIANRHRQLGVGFFVPHGPLLASHVWHRRHRVVSPWLDLHRRVTDYRLSLDRGGVGMGWVRRASERSRQAGPGLMPGSRVRETEAGVGLRLRRMEIGLRHRRRVETFTAALPYLAAAHHAQTRSTGVTLVPALGPKTNLKVVLNFENRRILSPDPYRPRTTKNLFLTIQYKFKNSPLGCPSM